MPRSRPSLWLSPLSLFALLVASSCSSSSDSSSPSSSPGFTLDSISSAGASFWELNRPVDFRFSHPVNLSTVHANSLSIRDDLGASATGTFSLINPFTVRFQPDCPLLPDWSDAGFLPKSTDYQISVWGSDTSLTNLVEATSGATLKTTKVSSLVTPPGTQPHVAFIDMKLGPATPVLRQLASDGSSLNPTELATRLEIAAGAASDIEFTFASSTGTFSVPIGLGQNLYSQSETHLGVLVQFDQAVSPSLQNISSESIRLEAQDALIPSLWVPIPTVVTLESNCGELGTLVRLQPSGILPPDRELRVFVDASFQDISGAGSAAPLSSFAHFQTGASSHPGLPQADLLADEIHVGFLPAGPYSFEGEDESFIEPRAIWGDNGFLRSAVDGFEGTGGDDGAFDWVITSGTTFALTTVGDTLLLGGDLGVDGSLPYYPSKAQVVSDGQVQVRHFVVEDGAILRIQGGNAFELLATGNVTIEGKVIADGFDRPDIATLNTANQPELGAAGAAGGGRGGVASWLTTTSTPYGGAGAGSFGVPDQGGLGGEAGYGLGPKDTRRPGGGGGGTLGKPVTGATDITFTYGSAAQDGFAGGLTATGAVTGHTPPEGGLAGPSPFTDQDPSNDYFGKLFQGGAKVPGELQALVAGQGGGAGGDAVPATSFPHPTFSPGTDEKGCGGGGGAGAISIRSLGDIRLSGTARISADGGNGGAGENTIGNDHLGGGSGGGSGGFILLSTAGHVIFDGVTENCISALGGFGGKGISGFASINAGGAGGPGIVQVHVSDPVKDILFQGAFAIADTLEEVTFPDALVLVSAQGHRSRARSRWISVGGAAEASDGSLRPIEFFAKGFDPATGSPVDADGNGMIDEEPALFGPTFVAGGSALPFISVDGSTLHIDGASLFGGADDIYLRNPQLLRDATIEFENLALPGHTATWRVAAATYDETTHDFALEIADAGFASLWSFVPASGVNFRVYPRTLEIWSGGVVNALPLDANVTFTFQGVSADANGLPLDGPPLVDWTHDLTDFNAVAPGALDFIRFDVLLEFGGSSVIYPDAPRPSVNFFRMPIRF